ncbi:MAG TPA: hypothetical protein VKR32_09995 [Puia sp.]|nr:hypothetical protein [Puia sp.]
MTTYQMDEDHPNLRREEDRFSEIEIKRIVKEVKSGARRRVIVKKYSAAQSTIANWMRAMVQPRARGRSK